MGRLDDGDSSVLGSARHKAARISGEMEELVVIRKRISDCAERKTIRKRMGDRLGGPKMLVASEAAIVVVLLLLLYDFTAGPDETRPVWLS